MRKPNARAIGLELSDRLTQLEVMDVTGIVDGCARMLDEDSLRKKVPLLPAEEGVVPIETGTRSAWAQRVREGRESG